MRILSIAAIALALSGSAAIADPWKDESGKGKWRGGYERYDGGFDRRGRYREAVRVPRGHLPPPGECRTWYPNRPAGHQPPPYRC
jgi:hypothetical protein